MSSHSRFSLGVLVGLLVGGTLAMCLASQARLFRSGWPTALGLELTAQISRGALPTQVELPLRFNRRLSGRTPIKHGAYAR